jgi:peptidyl-prolyl cis-trans isomerase SurA
MVTVRKFICLALLISPVFAASMQQLDHVVAIVNEQAILQSDIDNTLAILVPPQERDDPKLQSLQALKVQVLKKLVDNAMLLQFAEKTGVSVDNSEVAERIQSLANSQKISLSTFYDSLAEMGVTPEKYRNFLHDELIVARLQENLVHQDLVISDAEIRGFLESPAGQDQTGVEYKVSHILLSFPNTSKSSIDKTNVEAKELVTALKNGANFAKIAIEKSSSPNALNGGDLGWRTTAQLPSLFANNIAAMQVGEVYGPIKTDSGLHIIKLEQKRFETQAIEQEYHVQQILIKTSPTMSSQQAQQTLASIKSKLEKGGDFGKLAKQYSEEKNTATKGGDLGWITKDQMTPKFFAHINKLKLNIISEPFQSEQGWHLAVLLSQRSQVNSIESARNNAMHAISLRKRQEIIETWLKRLREQTKVEIIDKDYAKS